MKYYKPCNFSVVLILAYLGFGKIKIPRKLDLFQNRIIAAIILSILNMMTIAYWSLIAITSVIRHCMLAFTLTPSTNATHNTLEYPCIIIYITNISIRNSVYDKNTIRQYIRNNTFDKIPACQKYMVYSSAVSCISLI